jgi:O-acetyl-ADP-ribose deacetylase (regulator of RNase III)
MIETIEVQVARIERLAIDAIVNPANSALAPGAGADGAIRAGAGPELTRLLDTMDGLAEGAALATPGFRLPARWVIHTVAPRWHAPGSQEEKKATLRACYSSCLTTAAEIGAGAIAFPAIGTGIYGWPKDIACAIAVGVIRAHPAPISRVVFCCFTAEDAAIYEAAMARGASG